MTWQRADPAPKRKAQRDLRIAIIAAALSEEWERIAKVDGAPFCIQNVARRIEEDLQPENAMRYA